MDIESSEENVSVYTVDVGEGIFISAEKSIDEKSEDAISAFDARALRLAVGLDKSDGTAEWHDYIAADIDKNGELSSFDALNILKYAVGLNEGPSIDWVFVDGEADWSEVDERSIEYDEGVQISELMFDVNVDLTGILVGDVDGSYVV